MSGYDEFEQRSPGLPKSALRDMLKAAVVNTGGKAIDGKVPLDPTRAKPAPKVVTATPAHNPAPAPEPTRQRKHTKLQASDGDIRRIDVSALQPVTPQTEPGEKPTMEWIAIGKLYVDDRYQRNVLERGLTNVYSIARSFDWRKFTPVIVARNGGRFAIVDGQHRSYAAALRGLDAVPCLVINATFEEQASAFAAINTRVTRISELHVHHAAVAAGEDEANAVADACRAAGVEICRYPVPENKMKPGQTLAIGALRKCLKQHGPTILQAALRGLRDAHPDVPGVIRAPLIRAICEVMSPLRADRLDYARQAAAKVDFVARLSEARAVGGASMSAMHAHLVRSLTPDLIRRATT
jgi:hypothetical protein